MRIERTTFVLGGLVAAGLTAAPLWVDLVTERGEADVAAASATMDVSAVVAGTAAHTDVVGSATHADPLVIAPDEVEWNEGPPSIPAGAEAALLEGNPGAEGEIFVFRLKFPPGYTLPPHFHPVDERVTVISGTFHLGMGETLDRDRARALPAGSQFLMPPGHPHFAFTEDEGAVIQLTSIGPWKLEYVDPADDPRQAAAGDWPEGSSGPEEGIRAVLLDLAAP